MTLTADVTLNQLRILIKSTGAILSYINKTKIFLYYVNKGPVIFRVILKRDKNSGLFLQSLPPRIELRSELGKNTPPIDMHVKVNRITNKPKSKPKEVTKISSAQLRKNSKLNLIR